MVTLQRLDLPSVIQKFSVWTGGLAIAGLVLVIGLGRHVGSLTSIPFWMIVGVIMLSSSLGGIVGLSLAAILGNEGMSATGENDHSLKRSAVQLQPMVSYQSAHASHYPITSILESITDAFVSLDTEWRYVYVSRKAGDLFKRRPEDLIGKNIWEEFPESVGQTFYHAYHKAMAEQTPIQLEDYYPPWDRWFENRIYPSAEGLAIFFQDTTERKQIEAALQQATEGLETRVEERTAELTEVNDRLQQELHERQRVEKALRESQTFLQAIIDNSPAVIYLADAQNKLLLVNRQHECVLGLPEEYFVGKTIDAVFPAELAAAFILKNQEVLTTKQPLEYEELVQHQDGELHTYLSIRFPLLDEQGTAQMVCGICTDITERAQIAHLKDEFISIVSHELRTPLTSIHGALNLLSEGLVDPQSDWGKRTIAIAADGADHLVRLVDDILNLERLESNQVSLTIQSCNLAEVMGQAIDLMQFTAEQAHVTLSASLLSVQIDADVDRVIQVLTNLLSNAIKFSPSGTTVRLSADVSVEADLQAVRVQVSDRGRGIAADQLEMIFDRFHQVDASDARQRGGTGLGLAICRSIVQQHGGKIWAESVLGEGSCISFTLPIVHPS